MDWKTDLEKLKGLISDKTKQDELSEIRARQNEKEFLKFSEQTVKTIFPRIKKVFGEFASTIRLDKKWRGAIVEVYYR